MIYLVRTCINAVEPKYIYGIHSIGAYVYIYIFTEYIVLARM